MPRAERAAGLLPRGTSWALALAAAPLLAACAPRVVATLAPGVALSPPRDPASESLSLTGTRRRSIEPYRDVWVVADVEASYDLDAITESSRRERVHYAPRYGAAFDVMEDVKRPAGPRAVDGAVLSLPGVKLAGTVVQALPASPGRRSGTVIVDVDNTRRLLVPGASVALAVHTDQEPVVLFGTATLPSPPSAPR